MNGESSGGAGILPELLGWIERYGEVGLGAREDVLAEGAFRALDRAITGPGCARETAYALLAADALMTEVVDHLLADEDPGARLRELVERLTSGGGPVER